MERDDSGEKGFESSRAADVEVLESESPLLRKTWLDRIWKFLSASGVELRGVQPVPEELRTDSAFNKIFTLWCTSLINTIPIVTGITGTLSFGMSLRDTVLLATFFSLLLGVPPAYIQTISPKTGMRQLIQSRYTFGMYPNILIVIVNMVTLAGYQSISLVSAGQILAAVSDNKISQDVGIVIIAICTLIPAFGGFQFIHHYARWAWIPALIAIVITVGSGGKDLHRQAPTQPLTVSTAFTFISLIAGAMLTYCAVVGDVAVYLKPSVSPWRMFFYCWAGITVPWILLLALGAAMGGAVPSTPAWAAANDRDAAGGILVAMLEPLGGFGKFVAVVLAFTLIAQIAPGFYTVSLNFQIIWPKFAQIPRILFVIVITAVDIGISIKAAESFFNSLEDFLGVIGYWSAAFTGIMLTEWLYFRRARPESYDPAIWNNARALPSGLPALAAFLLPFALVIPSMAEAWYTGPIAKTTGDLGFEFALVLSILLYWPLRTLEVRLRGGQLQGSK